MRFYGDENFPLAVIIELRRLGHDVLTAFEDGRANRAIPDDALLARSTRLGRAVLTINHSDFRRLHTSGRKHAGILICTFDSDFIGQAGRIHDICVESESIEGELLRVNRQG
ncbi:MAG: DUF5615 family PIN-like protein [Pyrinomonadaceae bacterium]